MVVVVVVEGFDEEDDRGRASGLGRDTVLPNRLRVPKPEERKRKVTPIKYIETIKDNIIIETNLVCLWTLQVPMLLWSWLWA